MDTKEALEIVFTALEAGIRRISVEGENKSISGITDSNGTHEIIIRKLPYHGNK